MLKIKVTEKSGASIEYQSPVELNYTALGHGLSERWVPTQENIDPADILEREMRKVKPATDDAPAEMQEFVKLRAEYQIEIEDITARLDQERINSEALEYLASTDWLIIREIDAGVACPAEIKEARAEARARIVR